MRQLQHLRIQQRGNLQERLVCPRVFVDACGTELRSTRTKKRIGAM